MAVPAHDERDYEFATKLHTNYVTGYSQDNVTGENQFQLFTGKMVL